MKVTSLFAAGLAVGILSIASANADNKCSTTTFPILSAVQCSKPRASSYLECTSWIRQGGWEDRAAWWYCSSQGFKH
jgi:hypothetical protein